MNTARSTNNNTAIQEQSFTVPADMVMDVLQVVFNYGVAYRISEVNSDESYLRLDVNSKRLLHHYHKAIRNIEVLLDEYNAFERSCDIR